MVKDLIEFIDNSPTAFGAVESIKNILIENGYEQLSDKIEKGKKYYIKVRGINKKKKGKFSKVEVIIPDYTDLDEDDANAGFDGDYYIDEDY